MLLQLSILNIALIERLTIDLGPGLNVLTGETGAGKSIVVDSLNLALGGRADRELIRAGADKARVEALFDVSQNPEAVKLLGAWGLEPEDGYLAVSRELTQTGRNLCRACAGVVTLAQLRQLTALLVDVHGQHEHQQLCDPNNHLRFLDAYGDSAHAALMDEVARLSAQYTDTRRAADKLRIDAAERARRVDMLTFQLSEIDAVKPKAGEEEKLKRKAAFLLNAERIATGVRRACDLVYRGAGRSLSAQEALKKAAGALSDIQGLDDRFDALRERLNDLFYSAQDAGYELSALEEGLEFDPADADRISARLAALNHLTGKYGPTVEDVLVFRERCAASLSEIEGGDERLRALEAQCKAQKAALTSACARLTDSRKAIARTFEERLLAELKDLGMARARFETRFEREASPGASGADKVEFMLSANPGQPLKPLSAVASGGELSRIMLAMKAIAADSAGVNAMVFDEIDTGVSGHMAQVVGEKMAAIAARRQVICVTHLPQIAALGDRQYLVEKTVTGDSTGSTVRLLTDQGRVAELSRMIGGAADFESGREHAANLLAAARARTQVLRAEKGKQPPSS